MKDKKVSEKSGSAAKSGKPAEKKSAKKMPKYIFVTGGVLSGVGKGITAASIGAILKAKGFKVSIQKCDPYLNVDAGLLNPVEHGECFVTADGKETDLDLGHYERFLDFETSRYSSVLSGALYQELIDKERSGGFHGRTVQMVPHFTDLVQEKIAMAGKDSDIHIVEIGGTVGDYEGLSFIEAIRLFANRVGRENCLYVHVVYVPWINTSKELKTKPAQNALKDLRGFGIIPDVVVCRTEKPAPRSMCEKIAAFSGIPGEAVLNLPDIDSVYDVPFNVLKSGVLEILNKFVGDSSEPDMSKWEEFSRLRGTKWPRTVRVGLVAKYVGNEDAYICVTEALKAAAAWDKVNLEIVWLNAEEATDEDFAGVDGLVVPGGFGVRGAEGKIRAATYALEHDKPYLGLCLGMQMACVAAARKGGVAKAGSEEFGAGEGENVIYIMEGQKGKESTGGTMRLGNCPARLSRGSKVAEIYGELDVVERHRHRYEVNQKFLPEIEKGGVVVAGTSPDGKLVEFVEAPKCKFFVGTQAHPELKSRPLNVHPLFREFVKSL
jgi:CTP synthase